MSTTWHERVLRLLRVPHEPDAPAGDAQVRVFNAAPNYLRYRMLRWALTQLGGVVGVLFALRFTDSIIDSLRDIPGTGGDITVALAILGEALAIAGFIAQAVGSLLLLRLDFEQRWYIVSDRSIRIREGLVRLHEKTMTFANIQHVTVQQGPLQRLLGIADIEVRSAGGGTGSAKQPDESGDDLHVAHFHGVADAEGIRDVIAERMRVYRDSGLGDPDDDVEQLPAPAPTSLLDSAHELTREARLLREALAPR